jgi:uncharacterized membrane protein YhaH (DUF805 family)
MEWFVKVVTQHYADFGGRARRAEYWWFTLMSTILAGAAGVGSFGLAWATGFGAIKYVGYLVGIGLAIPGLAVAVRRLHDTGKSGWLLAPCVIPVLGQFYALVLLYFMVSDSTPGNNQYGPNPKGV